MIAPFCAPHFICLNICFWQGSFVWKCCVFIPKCFQLKNGTPIFEKGFRFSEIWWFHLMFQMSTSKIIICPKTVPKNKILTENKLFKTTLWSLSIYFGFSGRSSQSQQKIARKITYFKYSFAQKPSLILRTLTQSTL